MKVQLRGGDDLQELGAMPSCIPYHPLCSSNVRVNHRDLSGAVLFGRSRLRVVSLACARS